MRKITIRGIEITRIRKFFVFYPVRGRTECWEFLCISCGIIKTAEKAKIFLGLNMMCMSCAISKGHEKTQETKKQYVINWAETTANRHAKQRNIIFSLSKAFIESIIFKPCTYCGIEPNQTYSTKIDIRFHGIDRVNNKIGYIESNCVSCCKTCNRAKGTMTLEEFMNYIDRLIHFKNNKKIKEI